MDSNMERAKHSSDSTSFTLFTVIGDINIAMTIAFPDGTYIGRPVKQPNVYKEEDRLAQDEDWGQRQQQNGGKAVEFRAPSPPHNP